MAQKGKASRRPPKHHPESVPILNPQTMDRDLTDHDRLEQEEEQIAHVFHRIDLDRSLGRDDPDDDMSENDQTPPEGNW